MLGGPTCEQIIAAIKNIVSAQDARINRFITQFPDNPMGNLTFGGDAIFEAVATREIMSHWLPIFEDMVEDGAATPEKFMDALRTDLQDRARKYSLVPSAATNLMMQMELRVLGIVISDLSRSWTYWVA